MLLMYFDGIAVDMFDDTTPYDEGKLRICQAVFDPERNH
jgi:hypothetical protein